MPSPFSRDAVAGRVALVTGGTSGIGLEIARQLGLHGCDVVVTGRREAVLQSAVASLRQEGISVQGFVGDVRKEDDCKRWVAASVEAFGHLDVLVNCAAGNFLSAAEELSVNGFRTVMEIDAVGTFSMCRAAFAALATRPSCVVNISATLHYGATHYQVHASAAKAAVDSITRTLALEWGEHGIRVNGIAPGPIKGTAGMAKLGPQAGSAMPRVEDAIPVGRMGDKADIALAVVYLASSAASFISGHTLVVDGAAWMWRPPMVPKAAVRKVSRSVEGRSRAVGTAQSKL